MLKKRIMSLVVALGLMFAAFVNTCEIKADGQVRDVDDYRMRLSFENVMEYTEYGHYERVSDNVDGYPGDSVSCTYSITYSVEISGNTDGAFFKGISDKSTAYGYTLRLQSKGSFYMACRPVYTVKEGDRVVRTADGTEVGRNHYVVKIPQYLEYTLIRA